MQTGAEPAGMENDAAAVPEIELRRRETIARNNAYLKQLGLLSPADAGGARNRDKKEKKKKRQDHQGRVPPSLPTRSSCRTRGSEPEFGVDGLDAIIETEAGVVLARSRAERAEAKRAAREKRLQEKQERQEKKRAESRRDIVKDREAFLRLKASRAEVASVAKQVRRNDESRRAHQATFGLKETVQCSECEAWFAKNKHGKIRKHRCDLEKRAVIRAIRARAASAASAAPAAPPAGPTAVEEAEEATFDWNQYGEPVGQDELAAFESSDEDMDAYFLSAIE